MPQAGNSLQQDQVVAGMPVRVFPNKGKTGDEFRGTVTKRDGRRVQVDCSASGGGKKLWFEVDELVSDANDADIKDTKTQPVVFDMPIKYRVLADTTVREGLEKTDDKIGEHLKGTIIEVIQKHRNSKGIVSFQTLTPPKGQSRGGWVKLKTSKGKPLLEKISDDDNTEEPGEDTQEDMREQAKAKQQKQEQVGATGEITLPCTHKGKKRKLKIGQMNLALYDGQGTQRIDSWLYERLEKWEYEGVKTEMFILTVQSSSGSPQLVQLKMPPESSSVTLAAIEHNVAELVTAKKAAAKAERQRRKEQAAKQEASHGEETMPEKMFEATVGQVPLAVNSDASSGNRSALTETVAAAAPTDDPDDHDEGNEKHETTKQETDTRLELTAEEAAELAESQDMFDCTGVKTIPKVSCKLKVGQINLQVMSSDGMKPLDSWLYKSLVEDSMACERKNRLSFSVVVGGKDGKKPTKVVLQMQDADAVMQVIERIEHNVKQIRAKEQDDIEADKADDVVTTESTDKPDEAVVAKEQASSLATTDQSGAATAAEEGKPAPAKAPDRIAIAEAEDTSEDDTSMEGPSPPAASPLSPAFDPVSEEKESQATETATGEETVKNPMDDGSTDSDSN